LTTFSSLPLVTHTTGMTHLKVATYFNTALLYHYNIMFKIAEEWDKPWHFKNKQCRALSATIQTATTFLNAELLAINKTVTSTHYANYTSPRTENSSRQGNSVVLKNLPKAERW